MNHGDHGDHREAQRIERKGREGRKEDAKKMEAASIGRVAPVSRRPAAPIEDDAIAKRELGHTSLPFVTCILAIVSAGVCRLHDADLRCPLFLQTTASSEYGRKLPGKGKLMRERLMCGALLLASACLLLAGCGAQSSGRPIIAAATPTATTIPATAPAGTLTPSTFTLLTCEQAISQGGTSHRSGIFA